MKKLMMVLLLSSARVYGMDMCVSPTTVVVDIEDLGKSLNTEPQENVSPEEELLRTMAAMSLIERIKYSKKLRVQRFGKQSVQPQANVAYVRCKAQRTEAGKTLAAKCSRANEASIDLAYEG